IPYIPLTYHTAVLHDDDVWNTSTQPRIVQVTLTIQNQDTGQQVFNQTQSLQMQACSGPESVEWRFVPIQVANYIATVSDNRGNVSMIFNSILDATKSQTVSLPLEQFKSGTPSLDVKCNDGLQLILKAEDASPACVKPDTAQILIERGWAWNYANVVGKESISLSAYQGVSDETFYNNGTVASNFTINVNINNFKPSNTSLVLQVYYNDGILYKTVSVPSGMIQPDGFYKYHLIAVSDENHPVPFKVVATYNNETTIAYAPVFVHP
ncbi:MAG: hypothetical protein KGI27_14325, partial [Thaumarchaeota archaeon]|nr:hypothetical protein [Nitrososphaerota archaeon]